MKLILLLLFSIASSLAVSLEWDANPEPVSGYRVYFGSEGARAVAFHDVGKVTEYNVDHILIGNLPGTTTFFTVTAYNSSGESKPSNEVSHTVIIPAPDAPKSLRLRFSITTEGREFSREVDLIEQKD